MALIAHATSAEASYLCICLILFSTLLYTMQMRPKLSFLLRCKESNSSTAFHLGLLSKGILVAVVRGQVRRGRKMATLS